MCANVLCFLLSFAGTGISSAVNEQSAAEITDEWSLPLRPSGWAFSIWGPIYLLNGVFVVYQALPSKLVPRRNNDMLYNQINALFVIN